MKPYLLPALILLALLANACTEATTDALLPDTDGVMQPGEFRIRPRKIAVAQPLAGGDDYSDYSDYADDPPEPVSPICYSTTPMGTVAIVRPTLGEEIPSPCGSKLLGVRWSAKLEVLANLAGEPLPTQLVATFDNNVPGVSIPFGESAQRNEDVLVVIYPLDGEYFIINMQYIGLDGAEVYPGAAQEGILPQPLPDTLPELAEAFQYADTHFEEICAGIDPMRRLKNKELWRVRASFFRKVEGFREDTNECLNDQK